MTDEEKKAIEFVRKRTNELKHYAKREDETTYDDIILNLIEKQSKEIEELKQFIDEYEKECRHFKAFCRRVRKKDKHDIDLFNQGQEQKCNQFLNLLSGEHNWTYEGKYFDETDREIEQIKENK